MLLGKLSQLLVAVPAMLALVSCKSQSTNSSGASDVASTSSAQAFSGLGGRGHQILLVCNYAYHEEPGGDAMVLLVDAKRTNQKMFNGLLLNVSDHTGMEAVADVQVDVTKNGLIKIYSNGRPVGGYNANISYYNRINTTITFDFPYPNGKTVKYIFQEPCRLERNVMNDLIDLK